MKSAYHDIYSNSNDTFSLLELSLLDEYSCPEINNKYNIYNLSRPKAPIPIIVTEVKYMQFDDEVSFERKPNFGLAKPSFQSLGNYKSHQGYIIIDLIRKR